MASERSPAQEGPCWRRTRPALACLLVLACAAFDKPADAQVCGNGVLEAGEECDDGNRASFDGCSANCRFEQTQRINQLAIKATTDAGLCPSNVFGGHALTATTLSAFNNTIAGSVADGSTSLLLYFAHGLDVATSAGTALQIGIFNASPFAFSAGYDGTNDVDWWYAIDPLELGAAQEPVNLVTGSIANASLVSNPGTFSLLTVLGGSIADLSLSGATIASTIGASSTPATYTAGTDRGHLASENLDPALQSFTTSDGSGAGTGLCGNISAMSLALTPVPPSLLAGGSSACTKNYTANNSFLDVLVSGCTFSFIALVNQTQPDKTDPKAPPAGSGGPYQLSADTTTHIVDACVDSGKTSVDLATCLNAAAYSSYFSFTTDRVIAKSSSAADVIFHDQFDVYP